MPILVNRQIILANNVSYEIKSVNSEKMNNGDWYTLAIIEGKSDGKVIETQEVRLNGIDHNRYASTFNLLPFFYTELSKQIDCNTVDITSATATEFLNIIPEPVVEPPVVAPPVEVSPPQPPVEPPVDPVDPVVG
jgi:hypothetical protein